MLKIKIINKLPWSYLNKRLRKEIKQKYVSSEQLFRNPDSWYALTAYSNPYKTVYSELALLEQNAKKINQFIKNKNLVLYGIGTGDTEMALIGGVLKENNQIKIIGIDVQKKFIDNFIHSLKNLDLESYKYKLDFVGIAGLLQDIKRDDLGSISDKFVHAILGSTIGNFPKEEIWNVLKKLSNRTDLLIVGFHTDTNLKEKFKQYSTNKVFEEFIRKNLPSIKKVVWKLNKKESQIEGWANDILVFHSRKTSPKAMMKDARAYGFKNLFSVDDDNSCIQVFKKI